MRCHALGRRAWELLNRLAPGAGRLHYATVRLVLCLCDCEAGDCESTSQFRTMTRVMSPASGDSTRVRNCNNVR
jgi:hypothetical protein